LCLLAESLKFALPDYKKQSRSWEANSRSSSQESPRLLL
jgi:hypothetical protein